jgi:hypothetical protein
MQAPNTSLSLTSELYGTRALKTQLKNCLPKTPSWDQGKQLVKCAPQERYPRHLRTSGDHKKHVRNQP